MPPKKKRLILSESVLKYFNKDRQSENHRDDSDTVTVNTADNVPDNANRANGNSDTQLAQDNVSQEIEKDGPEPVVETDRQQSDTDRGDETQAGGAELEAEQVHTPIQVKFQSKWLQLYSWLRHDTEKNVMYCDVCRTAKMKNTMALGTNNFRTTTLVRHVACSDHHNSLRAPLEQEVMKIAFQNAASKKEQAILVCLKVVYWMSKEAVPLSKYTSLMELLTELDTPNIEELKVNDRVSYNSYSTACDLLDAISGVIDTNVTDKISKSPTVTILTDESTDITTHHKLCLTARILDPITMAPSTHFLTDLRIHEATGAGIFDAIQKHLETRNIPLKKVTGLGTDGATVMTGRKQGLTGHFLRGNPHLVNTHCAAHRVALCSEQAAEKIPAMKYYQGILESIYYFFKKSPKKCDGIEAVQNLLQEPQLKYREVHEIRWLSFYQALDTVYRTLDSLLTFFNSLGLSDPKAVGLKKKIGEDFFILMTYSMMDILQPVIQLSLFFQRKDIDIGCVQINVENCLKDLVALQDETPAPNKSLFADEVKKDLVNSTFKGNHTIKKSKYSFTSAKRDFIQAIIDNITKRFPDGQIMTSFWVLGLRPVTLLSVEEAEAWGNDSMEVLVKHFGQKRSHQFKDQHTNQLVTVNSDPVIDPDATVEEWKRVKQVIRVQGYPRNSSSEVWSLLKTYHEQDFPNLLKLAELALTHPVHTSDCERAFSAQNHVTTPLRNRLSSEHSAQLMRIMIEGPLLVKFDFLSALNQWTKSKSRVIFKKRC